MTESIESFVAKLKSEGLEAGQQQADQLRQKAQHDADEILAKAKQQAEKIVADANAQAQSSLARSRTELELAARDAALKLREALTGVLQGVLAGPVQDQLSNAEFLKDLLKNIANQYAQADAKGIGSVKLNVAPELQSQLAQWASENLKAAQAGAVDVTGTLKQAGFELNTTGATIEVTQESVVATLMELVGPSLRDVFKTAMAGQKE